MGNGRVIRGKYHFRDGQMSALSFFREGQMSALSFFREGQMSDLSFFREGQMSAPIFEGWTNVLLFFLGGENIREGKISGGQISYTPTGPPPSQPVFSVQP